MPGHKGVLLTGHEHDDITEVTGADSLYEASGIIGESEANASLLFGCPTYYSTEGSSQCIRAMLHLANLWSKREHPHGRFKVLAGRNAHKTFLSAVALLDVDVVWLTPAEGSSYLSCPITADDVERALDADEGISAVYLTSPDYLGHTLPIADISKVCHTRGVKLLVDNAHGAYLKFLPESKHPMDQGADLCCDSAHKTLPVLTGGAYLHISEDAPSVCTNMAKQALSLFGSTSPSYLILRSLDMANAYLSDGYAEKLYSLIGEVAALRGRLSEHGFTLVGDEPIKLTLLTKPYGYRGQEMATLLEKEGIVCEFADPDFLVFMLTPEVGTDGLARLEAALVNLPRRDAIAQCPPPVATPERVLSVREAMLSPAEVLDVKSCVGRVLGAATVGCPPAVPIVVSGERINEDAVACFAYYGIKTCMVVREDATQQKRTDAP